MIMVSITSIPHLITKKFIIKSKIFANNFELENDDKKYKLMHSIEYMNFFK